MQVMPPENGHAAALEMSSPSFPLELGTGNPFDGAGQRDLARGLEKTETSIESDHALLQAFCAETGPVWTPIPEPSKVDNASEHSEGVEVRDDLADVNQEGHLVEPLQRPVRTASSMSRLAGTNPRASHPRRSCLSGSAGGTRGTKSLRFSNDIAEVTELPMEEHPPSLSDWLPTAIQWHFLPEARPMERRPRRW